jgi:chromosomal replication initiator protein
VNNFIPTSHATQQTTDRSATTIWATCLQSIRQKVKPLSFKTWFEPIVATSLDDGLLTIEVPSSYFYEWLEEHYFNLLQSTIQEVIGQEAKLQYAVRVPNHILFDGNNHPNADPSQQTGTTQPSGSGRALEAVVTFESNLNHKFNFENFIRGDGNQFARAASLNVAQHPGETAFNPLVLYGGVGLGKTHLLQAIGNSIQLSHPSKKIYYVSSERFTIDFVEAIEKNRTIDFSNFYRNIDVLIVDDIQFFAGKERTQDTFFHIFNTLYQLKKQIVLSSDRPPKDLLGLDERLISRFQSGLTVDVQPPDLETRIAILRRKAESDHVELPQEVIDYIASNVKSNIRELEGCYIGVIARHTLDQRPIDLQLAETVLRNVILSEKKNITIEQIQKLVADHFKISENSLRAKTRKKEIVVPRQIAIYLAKHFTHASLKTIGLHFGGRDHSTIIHACRTVENDMETDTALKTNVQNLEKHISHISS